MLRSLAGGTLFGEAWGSPPARVLALHGWARSHDDFAPAFGQPPDGPGVVAPDLPGFGATPQPPSPWGSAEYANSLLGLFAGHDKGGGGGQTIGVVQAPAVVVGHSFGGRVALDLAVNRPELVGALVLSGVPLLPRPGRPRRPPLAYRTVRALRRVGLVGEERLERARQRYGSPDYRNAQGVMRAVLVRVLGERYEDQLQQLRCPLELVWADDDTEAPLVVAEAVEKLVPGAVLTRCGPVGHLTPLTAAPTLRAAVERALTITGS